MQSTKIHANHKNNLQKDKQLLSKYRDPTNFISEKRNSTLKKSK